MVASLSLFRIFAVAAETRPARLFWGCIVAHLLLWTVIPTLTDPNVLTDTIEGYAWGREWLLGTYKHPPLASWILELFAFVTGRAPWAHFLASQISVAVAFWAVWQTGRRIVSESEALIGALLLTGVAYYNILIPEFNPNVLQLPFWALIGWSFHCAVKDDRTADWLMLGLWSAAGVYTKYSTALILVALGILLIAHPESRKWLTGRGPWVAVLTAFILFLPQLLWLFAHHFMPFTYAEERFEHIASHHALLSLLMWQVAALLPAILIYGISFGRKQKSVAKNFHSFDSMFLYFATFGPVVLASIIAIFFGVKIRNMWGTPFWNFLGLWLVFVGRPVLSFPALRRFAILWSLVLITGIFGYAVLDLFQPYITHKASRIYFPGPTMAAQISDAWRQRYHTPLRYVIGDVWAAGNVGYYAPENPHVFINGDYEINPWVTPDEIRKYGGIIIWCRGDCTHQDNDDVPIWFWKPEFRDNAEVQPILTFPQQTGASVPPVKIGWAFMPPHEAEKP